MLWNVLMLLDSSTVIVGGGGGSTAPAAAEVAADAGAAASGGFFGSLLGGSGFTMVLIYAAVIGAMWFFMIRPQRKREKEMREMQAALKVGDNVVTSSGFFGRIVSVGEDCFVVEFGSSKGVRVPVRKSDIIGNASPNMSGTGE